MAATQSPSQASENQDAIALFRRVYIFMGIKLSGFGGGRVGESGILEGTWRFRAVGYRLGEGSEILEGTWELICRGCGCGFRDS